MAGAEPGEAVGVCRRWRESFLQLYFRSAFCSERERERRSYSRRLLPPPSLSGCLPPPFLPPRYRFTVAQAVPSLPRPTASTEEEAEEVTTTTTAAVEEKEQAAVEEESESQPPPPPPPPPFLPPLPRVGRSVGRSVPEVFLESGLARPVWMLV